MRGHSLQLDEEVTQGTEKEGRLLLTQLGAQGWAPEMVQEDVVRIWL